MPLGEVEAYSRFVHIADTYAEYAEAVMKAITGDSETKRLERAAVVSDDSWYSKVEKMSRLIAEHISLNAD